MGVTYFFDLSIYRLERDKYYKQRDAYIENVLFPPDSPYSVERRAKEKTEPGTYVAMRDHLERSYGGCWEFNEIISYIRLHFLGIQVRGEHFGVSRKRVVRTRTKTLEYQTWKLAPEVNIQFPISQVSVLNAIREYIQDCRKELPGKYIDASMFEAIAVRTDWLTFFRLP